LHALDVVDDGGKQRSRGVPGKECSRAAQERSVKVVAQVCDHAEAGMIYQVRSGVVTDSF
jgi:hypothetical protein